MVKFVVRKIPANVENPMCIYVGETGGYYLVNKVSSEGVRSTEVHAVPKSSWKIREM